MTNATGPDVDVRDEGTIVLFTPRTPAALDWIDEHVADGAMYFGGALVVDHRYASDIADGMAGDGLELEVA